MVDMKGTLLAIPTPCQQRWQDMKNRETGRFCESCQKIIVDFVEMSDPQIMAYLANAEGHVCGRLSANQLNRNLIHRAPVSGNTMKQRWLGFIAAGLMSWSTAQGQDERPAGKQALMSEIARPKSTAITKGIAQQEDNLVIDESTWIVEGQVIMVNGLFHLPGVSVLVKGTNLGAVTDTAGLFKLSVPHYQGDKLVLRVSSIGFISREIEVSATKKRQLVISLSEDSQLLGEVIYTGYVEAKKKPTFYQKLKRRLRTSY